MSTLNKEVTKAVSKVQDCLKKRRSSSALKQTPLLHPVSRPVGMTGVEETAKDTTASTGSYPGDLIIVDSSTTTPQTASPAAAAASAQSVPSSSTAQPAQPAADQSAAGQKASSAPKGTKRRL